MTFDDKHACGIVYDVDRGDVILTVGYVYVAASPPVSNKWKSQ